jgi:membrane fusion protein, multidrug efflux system
MSKIRWLSVVALVLVVAFLLAKRAGVFEGTAKDSAAPSASAAPLNVSAVKLTPRTVVEMFRSTGTLLPEEEVQLTAEVAGRIVHIGFDEGQRVEKGTVLLRVDDEPVAAQLLKVTHQLSLARTQERRIKELMAIQAVSQEELDRASTDLMALKADSTLLAVQRDRTVIRAPFSGTMGLRSVSPGQYVTMGTVIGNLVKTVPLRLEFSVPERHVHQVRNGSEVRFTVADGTERTARVYAGQPSIDPSTRSATLRARYPNADGALVPGFFAEVNVVLSETNDALSVPTEALIPELGRAKVLVARAGKVVPTIVTTGIRMDDEIEITSGLSAGDTVITTGILQLREGMPVSITIK